MKKKTKKATKKTAKLSEIEKLSKKLNIREREIKEIVFVEHEHANLVDPDSLVELELPMELDLYTELKAIADTLKVSLNSVVVGLLVSGSKDLIAYKEFMASKK